MGTEKQTAILIITPSVQIRTNPYKSVYKKRTPPSLRSLAATRGSIAEIVRIFAWGAKHPFPGAALANACRLWQTSEAQLSHRSRKGAEVSRRRFAFLQGDDEGADQTSVTESASEAKAQRSKRDNACRRARKYCGCSSDFCAERFEGADLTVRDRKDPQAKVRNSPQDNAPLNQTLPSPPPRSALR